jgi:tetratricopeptide (TPR) repeat protein
MYRFVPHVLLLAACLGKCAPASAQSQLDLAFHRMYELKFDEARALIAAYKRTQPDDPLAAAAEAASYLFEEFDRQGVLTSSFFLDDRKLLGGIEGRPDPKRRTAFLDANRRARLMAGQRLKANPKDPDALFVLALADGMQGDFVALIEKRQLASLRLIKRAEKEADQLLKVNQNAADAYLALGAANYIIGCLPMYKKVFLWFGGYQGDRQRGMDQLKIAASRGHYLQPLAKIMLALACEREHDIDQAVGLLEDLSHEFPDNPVFVHELQLARNAAGAR